MQPRDAEAVSWDHHHSIGWGWNKQPESLRQVRLRGLKWHVRGLYFPQNQNSNLGEPFGLANLNPESLRDLLKKPHSQVLQLATELGTCPTFTSFYPCSSWLPKHQAPICGKNSQMPCEAKSKSTPPKYS